MSSNRFLQFEQLRSMAEQEFDVEEGFIEYDTPTFYVKLRRDSKEAFLKLMKGLEPLDFAPVLRKRGEKTVLQVVPKPRRKFGRPVVNATLFFATIGTTLLSGYVISGGIVAEAVTFAAAVMAIMVSHEMGHKLLANFHGVESSAPYFIPGPPPAGTFGAVIQQTSLAPNKDALFDLGASGPIMGFVVTIIVTVIGIRFSPFIPSTKAEEMGATLIQMPILFRLLFRFLAVTPPSPNDYVMLLHPVAIASYIGMLVTMLNLIPMGMLDGGHTVRVSLGERGRRILSFLSMVVLFVLGQFLFAILAFSLSRIPHPGPLDDVSKLTTGRKLAFIVLISVFVLCAVPAPGWPIP